MADESAPPLASEFPASTREDWLRLVTTALKGGSYEDRLVSRTYDGLRIEPLYAAARHARPLAARTAAEPWQVMQRIELPDPAAANTEALHELENGATGLTLVFAGAIGAHGFGIAATEASLRRTLDGVHLDAGVAIELDLGASTRDIPAALVALVKAQRVRPQSTDIRFGLDPIGAIAATGTVEAPWAQIASTFAESVSALASQDFKGPFAVADGRPVHAAGGSEAQELAFALSAAVAYLRALEAAGIALDAARKMIFFRLAADADQFLTIAKFRALRMLWARVESACGLTLEPAFVSAETAWRMMTRRDPWVNLLRTTMATFSAGLGGANAITALPFTAALGLPDRFARRLARNLQLILLEESSLAKVMDPAAGSGGIEGLTDQLCAVAWTLFQEIEAAGGLFAALQSGVFQRKVAEVRAGREAAVARRKDALTGATEFPNLHELPVAVLETAPVAPPQPPRNPTLEPLRPIRLAEPFEQLRDASDRLLARDGSRPRIFLANLGKPSDFTARATFAKSFFETGGIEAQTNDGFMRNGDLAAAFKASGARLACLCSSDAVYEREGADAATAIASAGAEHIYLAGRPKERDALKAAGVKTFVYAGCDALATLRAAHDMLAHEYEPKR
jgi:methylmalonyl-CoA mutase